MVIGSPSGGHDTGLGDCGIGVLAGGVVRDGDDWLVAAAGGDADSVASEPEHVVVGAVQRVDQPAVLGIGVAVLTGFFTENGVIGVDGTDAGDDASLRLLVDVGDDVPGHTLRHCFDRGSLGDREVPGFLSQPDCQVTHQS